MEVKEGKPGKIKLRKLNRTALVKIVFKHPQSTRAKHAARQLGWWKVPMNLANREWPKEKIKKFSSMSPHDVDSVDYAFGVPR